MCLIINNEKNIWFWWNGRVRMDETRSLRTEKERISEGGVRNPYSFYDYVQAMAEHKGIKEPYASVDASPSSIWQTQPFSLLPLFANFTSPPFKSPSQPSHFLQVHPFSLSLHTNKVQHN